MRGAAAVGGRAVTVIALPAWDRSLAGCKGCTHPREWHEDSGSGAPRGRCLYGCGCEGFNRRRRTTKGTTLSLGLAPEQARGAITFTLWDRDALERAARELVTAATKLVEVLVAQAPKTNGRSQLTAFSSDAAWERYQAGTLPAAVDLPQPNIAVRPKAPAKTPRNDDDRPIGPGPEKILAAIVQHKGVRREVLSVYVGFTRSTRDSYIRKLIGRGLILDTDGALRATDAGVALADEDPLPTGAALREMWRQQLKPGPRGIFILVCTDPRRWFSRDEISDRTSYTRSTRDTYVRELSRRKLVLVDARGVQASAHLFEEGADHG